MNESEDIKQIQQELEAIPVRGKAMVKGKVLVSRPFDNKWCVNLHRSGYLAGLLGSIEEIRRICPG